MVISKDSWHYRVYRWQRTRLDNDVRSQINLCPYVRIVLIWAPLQWLLFAGKIIPRVYNFLLWVGIAVLICGYKFYHADRLGFFTVLAFIAIVAAGISIIVGIVHFMERRGKKLITNTAAFQLVTEYADAAHNKICPLLEVKSEQPSWEPV